MGKLKADVSEIKSDMKKLLETAAVHNEILRTHESRSLTLQEAQSVQRSELDKLKEHDKLWSKLAAILAAALVGGLAQALFHHFAG